MAANSFIQHIRKFLRGFYYAWKGICYTYVTQVNFKIQLFLAFGVVWVSYCLELNGAEWMWIIFSIALVLLAELGNTALEKLVDLVSPRIDPKAGVVKDISAGFVLLAAVFALTTGVIILLPKLLNAS